MGSPNVEIVEAARRIRQVGDKAADWRERWRRCRRGGSIAPGCQFLATGGVRAMSEFRSAGLKGFLERELAAGNPIVERGAWGEVQIVFLAGPFKTPPPDAATGLEFRKINDPHYWLAEVLDPATREVLACRY